MSKKPINLNTPLSEEIDMSLLKNITMRSKYITSSSNNITSSEIVNKNYNFATDIEVQMNFLIPQKGSF